ncbi:hypothetical protein M2281_002380 [Mesorhizobium soli]|uniref:DUF1259 domain-containing protein n=1 Tax=Pseudaminobacter soli (ex Li et al. 2025) TaxID=1295366 RepID=UPI0024757D6E|nr:DUF1259 domain-containing protein [Mesorhizobium soli]MDH6231782.1 hypothetical protein [Mesorhizobium soli]
MHAKFPIGAILLAIFLGQAHAEPDWTAVGKALGKSGTLVSGGIYRVGLPRSDLKVVLDGVELKPALALGSWLAFRSMNDSEVTVMGDLVLTPPEVNPVMMKLIKGDIEITALHNHLLRSDPATVYMHVLGRGDPVKLAASLHDALEESRTPLSDAGANAASPSTSVDLDTALIDQTLGHKGKVNGGVYQVSIPRAEKISEGGMDLPEAMGSANSINFQPTGNSRAAVTGDFVLIATEVGPVQRALRENGIDVTALHNHMLDDKPHLFFMHFWANDDVTKLTHGLRAALDRIHLAKD